MWRNFGKKAIPPSLEHIADNKNQGDATDDDQNGLLKRNEMRRVEGVCEERENRAVEEVHTVGRKCDAYYSPPSRAAERGNDQP